jgi:membrane protease YdiL (CAAX protease family)
VAFGTLLRVVQGWIEQTGTGYAAFPSYPLLDGRLSDTWWLTDAVAVVGIGPLVEEFYFRAVILIAVYAILRGTFPRTIAAISAVIVSAALFLLVHGLTPGVPLHGVLATGLLGLVCGSLVMLTGRIWGAVLVHSVFNATYVALALTGTFLV